MITDDAVGWRPGLEACDQCGNHHLPESLTHVLDQAYCSGCVQTLGEQQDEDNAEHYYGGDMSREVYERQTS